MSSTAPRFDPRWPPLTETASIRTSRISAASARSSASSSRRSASGPSIASSKESANSVHHASWQAVLAADRTVVAATKVRSGGPVDLLGQNRCMLTFIHE